MRGSDNGLNKGGPRFRGRVFEVLLKRALLLVLFLAISLFSSQAADSLKDHSLVIYNKKYSESEAIAREYIRLRDIPEERLLGLSCSIQEEISRSEYEATIEKPLDQHLREKGWIKRFASREKIGPKIFEFQKTMKNEIWLLILIHGIPLKIADDPDSRDIEVPAHLKTNAAAVDSELALFPTLGIPKTGFLKNLFFDLGLRHRFDVFDADQMMLVGRLDGPNPEVVRRMIRDAIGVEEKRLVGRVYLDLRGISDPKSTYLVGDQWIKDAGTALQNGGWRVDQDTKPALFPAWLPWSQVAFYLGWYGGTAEGPFMSSPCFSRGAIAYHIHSSSASTLRSSTQNWVGPLLSNGATASMGCVYEPYLEATPHPDILIRRLLDGSTFVEAAYASQKVLSWMVTVVGDPLYTPFKRPLRDDLKAARDQKSDRLPWLELQAEVTDAITHQKDVSKEVSALIPQVQGNPWVLEVAGDYLGEKKESWGESAACYEKALSIAEVPIDRIRIGSKLARKWALLGSWDKSYGVMEQMSKKDPSEFLKRGGVAELKWISGQAGAPATPASLQPYLKVEAGVLYE